jgi:hypothetical protein
MRITHAQILIINDTFSDIRTYALLERVKLWSAWVSSALAWASTLKAVVVEDEDLDLIIQCGAMTFSPASNCGHEAFANSHFSMRLKGCFG